VRISGGITVPTRREFEFIRIDVGVEMPCSPENVDECADRCSEWVEDRILKERDTLSEAVD
jgi:hypothetical protein